MDFYSSHVSDDTFSSLINGTKVFTDLSELVPQLSKVGVDGPRHYDEPNIDTRGRLIGRGAQFEVFEDTGHWGERDVVWKRVRLDASQHSAVHHARSNFRTLQLEIASLCDPIRRSNQNIVELLSWGYDYPSSELSSRVPVLRMEKALSTLDQFLRSDHGGIDVAATSYHFCLDIANGLHGIHLTGLVHGDLKPANVLVFQQSNRNVPFIAKLSDFGKCIEVNEQIRNFTVYAGTPGWKPPEVVAGGSHSTTTFQPSLLFKCDSYAYGLLALSVLAFRGQVVEGQELIGTDAFLQKIRRLSRQLPEYVEQCLGKVISDFLQPIPDRSANVDPSIFECGNKAFLDWQMNRRVPDNKDNSKDKSNPYSEQLYYRELDIAVLTQLETQFNSSTASPSLLTNDLLFGMAVRALESQSDHNRSRAARYLEAAAQQSSLPVRGIIQRLRNAIGSNGETFLPGIELDQWLFASASKGSLIAAEDLNQTNPQLALMARHEFTRLGGFNKNTSLIVRDRVLHLVENSDHVHDFNMVVDHHGNRPLHYTASYGIASLTRFLVDNGAYIDQRNDGGETALYKACLAGSVDCVKALVDLGADASLVTKPFGISCLHWLFNFDRSSASDVADLLLSQGARVDQLTQHVKNRRFSSQIPSEHFPFYWPQGAPIHWASFARSTVVVDILLANGASVDSLDALDDKYAQTALSMAAYRGDSVMVNHLLLNGANPNHLDGMGRSPAHMMAICSNLTEEVPPIPQALRWWVYHGSWQNHVTELTKCVQALVDHGANLDARTRWHGSDDNRHSAILDAVDQGNPGAVLALLNAGASSSSAGTYIGGKPLQAWTSVRAYTLPYVNAFRDVFKALLSSGPDLSACNIFGDSILHIAIANHSLDDFHFIASSLTALDPPISLEMTNRYGETPLLKAVRLRGSTGAEPDAFIWASMFLDMEVNVIARDHDNRDFLFHVCSNEQLSDVQCLSLIQKMFKKLPFAIQKDSVQMSIRRSTQKTALMAACRNSFSQVVSFLLTYGVDLTIVDKEGNTALDIALLQGDTRRQHWLHRWVRTRRLLFKGGTFVFNGLEMSADVLQNPDVLLNDDASTTFLFSRTVTESYVGNSTVDNCHSTARKYFACMEIVRALLSAKAPFARLIMPAKWDAEWVKDLSGDVDGFLPEMQPFYKEHWELLYTHKSPAITDLSSLITWWRFFPKARLSNPSLDWLYAENRSNLNKEG